MYNACSGERADLHAQWRDSGATLKRNPWWLIIWKNPVQILNRTHCLCWKISSENFLVSDYFSLLIIVMNRLESWNTVPWPLLIQLWVYLIFVDLTVSIPHICWFNCEHTSYLLIQLWAYLIFVDSTVSIPHICWFNCEYTSYLLIQLWAYLIFVDSTVRFSIDFCWFNCE